MEWLIVGILVFAAGVTLAARTLRNLKGYAAIASGAGPGEGGSACGPCTACDVGSSGGAPRGEDGLLACGSAAPPSTDGHAAREPAVAPRLRVTRAAPRPAPDGTSSASPGQGDRGAGGRGEGGRGEVTP